MLLKKGFVLLFVLLILAQSETLPGIDYIKCGYDGLKLLNNQLGQSKYPVFNLDPQNGEQDFQLNGKNFRVPITIQATVQSLRKETQCEGIYQSFSDFQKKYSESISFQAGLSLDSYSVSIGFNHQLDEIHEKMTQNNKSIAVSQSYWSMYSLTTAPAFLMPLNPMFKQSLDALNRMAKDPQNDTQQTIYNQVINSFGTHYVTSVVMGGSAKIFTTIDSEYLKSFDYEEVKNQVSLDFSYTVFKFKFGFDTTDATQIPSESFKKNSSNTIIFSPEVDHLQDPKAWSTWESQVPQKPQPVNTTVSYISELAFEYPEVQAHLRKTIEFYLKNGKLPTFVEIQNFQVALKEQTQLIPGADIVGCGFDSTSLEDKRCIFDLDGENYQWSNPNDPSIEFTVPEMLFVMNKPESFTLNGTAIFSTFQDFVKETFWETRQDKHGFLGFGAKHKRTQYHEFYEKIYQQNQKLILNLRQITWYTLKVPTFPNPPFNSIFEQSIKMLPTVFNSQTSQFFNQFIEAFGTHVVIEGDFGGLVYAEDWLETCLIKTHDEVWIKEQVSRRYDPFGFFRKDSTKQTDVKQISTDFKENSEYHALLLGGTEKIPLNDWDKWVPTIKYNPKALNRKIVPLTNFLPDGPQKDALSAALLAFRQQATDEQQAYISQLQQIAPPPKSVCSQNKLSKIQSYFTKRVLYNLLSQNIVDEAVQELCPFPGYHGTYCPRQSASFLAYKTSIEQSFPKFPSGIGASFDISTGELKLPAIQLSYSSEPSQEQIYKDPFSDLQFVIAEETQIEQINLDADIKIFKNEFELTNIWLNATKNGQWLGGEYSQSKDLNDVFERFFKGNQETSISQQAKNVVRLTFKSDNLKLNKFAQRAIDALPEEFQPEIYNEFLNSWGTHISVDTYIGGMIEKQTVFKDCVYATPSFSGGLSVDQVKQALQNELQGKTGDSYFVGRRRISIDHKFGGNPEDVANWESTISQNPALLKINKFVSWDNMTANPQVKANLQQVITNRIETMKQRQESHQAQVREERRIQNCASRPAYAVSGAGILDKISTSQVIQIKNRFTLKEAAQCPVGLPFDVSKKNCSSGNMDDLVGLIQEVRYERDNQGNFRTVLLNAFPDINKGPLEYYGPWVDRGCSIAQDNLSPQYQDFNYPPPNNSKFKMICTDCIPQVNETQAGKQLQCLCPGF